jgi:endonuclease/exonuclease/phosphatase (EEP) superfamily protein YafD
MEVAGLLACLATVVGFAGRLNWLLELTTHFRVQLAVGLALLAGSCVLGRRRWWGGLFAGFGGLNLALVLWVARPANPARDNPSASHLRLLSINVHRANLRADLVLAEIQRTQPDVVLLLEVDAAWLQALEPLRALFPTFIADPRSDNFGLALLARTPVEAAAVIELGGAEIPSVELAIQRGGQRVRLLGTHPLPPATPAYAQARNDQLQAVAEWGRRQVDPVIVLGDLNVTPWSPHFATLLREGGLQLARPAWSLAASWPAQLPAGLRLPLDHCLVAPGLRVVRYELGEPVGSDHLPLRVELLWPEPLAGPAAAISAPR